jgi:hypothetical protein
LVDSIASRLLRESATCCAVFCGRRSAIERAFIGARGRGAWPTGMGCGHGHYRARAIGVRWQWQPAGRSRGGAATVGEGQCWPPWRDAEAAKIGAAACDSRLAASAGAHDCGAS